MKRLYYWISLLLLLYVSSNQVYSQIGVLCNDWGDRIPAHNYSLPSGMHGNYPNILGQNNGVIGVDKWYYFSGEIDVNEQPFHYGFLRSKHPSLLNMAENLQLLSKNVRQISNKL